MIAKGNTLRNDNNNEAIIRKLTKLNRRAPVIVYRLSALGAKQ